MRALPLLLLLACGGATTEFPTEDSSPGGDSGAATGYTDVTWSTGESGELSYWNQGNQHRILLYAAQHLDGLPVPAACALRGDLCVAALPTVPDTATDWLETDYEPSDVGVTWLGNQIEIGPFSTDFEVFPQTGFGGYSQWVPEAPPGPIDVSTNGEWGSFTLSGALVGGDGLTGTIPGDGGYAKLDNGLNFSWDTGEGQLYMELLVEANDIHEVWLLNDDGSHSIPASYFGEIEDRDIIDVKLYRVETQPDIETNGNTLRVSTVSKVHFSAGNAQPPDCKSHRDSVANAPSGEYLIAPNPAGNPVTVWCDMDTDGGGWTLVAASKSTMNDEALDYHSDLTSLHPTGPHEGIWSGLRDAIPGSSDIRFACKTDVDSTTMTVDLSFYNTDWYREITTGTDNDSCFNDNNGIGQSGTPERRNNVTGDTRSLNDQWDYGYLEGEDSCGDTSDFTIDFDDRGMDSDESDGTDWGEDDNNPKCGIRGDGEAWFIFVR